MTFRWTVWGDETKYGELLLHSVGTFRRWFGADARYVVCSDKPQAIDRLLRHSVETIATAPGPSDDGLFDPTLGIAWSKWRPAVRIAPDDTEVYLDCDVFAVGDPSELREFSSGIGGSFLALPQPNPEPKLYGVFYDRLPKSMPALNAGLLVQQSNADLTADLAREYEWWKEEVRKTPSIAEIWHYEQGAVASALGSNFVKGRVEFLPESRYKLISPRSNAHLYDLSEIAIIHTTYPTHPGFRRFKDLILANSEFA